MVDDNVHAVGPERIVGQVGIKWPLWMGGGPRPRVRKRVEMGAALESRVMLDGVGAPDLNSVASESTLPPDRFETNETIDTATHLGEVAGRVEQPNLSIHSATDVDVFQFTTLDAGTIADFLRIDFASSVGDLGLYLGDSAGNVLYASFFGTDREEISFFGLPAGVYYAAIVGISGAQGGYSLSISAPEPPGVADRFEANESTETATDLGELAGLVTEPNLSIHAATDADVFRFTTLGAGNSAHFVRIDFVSSVGDLDLFLLDSAGSVLGESFYGIDREEISLLGRAAGFYYAVIVGFNGAQGDYSLSVNAPSPVSVPPDRFEFNDTTLTATDLGTVSGLVAEPNLSIHSATDVDLLQFTTLNTGTDADFVRIDFAHGVGDLDLFLMDSAGNEVRSSAGSSDHEEIALSGLPAGTYFARIFGYSGAQGDYSLRINAPERIPPDRFETNESLDNATVLGEVAGLVETSNLTIDSAADADVFRFTTLGLGAEEDLLRIDFLSSVGDLNLELLDSAGNVVASSFFRLDREVISLFGLPAGLYFARVSGFRGAQGGYSLSVHAPERLPPDRFETNETIDSATDLGEVAGLITETNLSIDTPSDVDVFKFATLRLGTPSDFVRIDRALSVGTIVLQVLDAVGNVLDSSFIDSDRQQISLLGRPAGVYFARVSSFSGARGNYSLSIDGALPAPDLVPFSFMTTKENLERGELLPIRFTVRNGGVVDSPAFDVRFVAVGPGLNGEVVLGSRRFPGLDAGRSGDIETVLVITDSVFSAAVGGRLQVQVRLDPGNEVAERDRTNNQPLERGVDLLSIHVVDSRGELEPNNTLEQANPLPGNTVIVGSVGPDDTDWYRLDRVTRGLLIEMQSTEDASGLQTDLLDETGRLIQVLGMGSWTRRLDRGVGESAAFLRICSRFAAEYQLVITGLSRPQVETVGNGPSRPVVTDVNGDGRADLVVANQGVYNAPGNSVSVLLGRGDGTFTAETRFAVGESPLQPLVIDVNEDGRADLIVANRGTSDAPGSTVSVLLGRGDGTFAAETRFSVGFGPTQPAARDLNGDGRPDLVVANQGTFSTPGNTISVLLGRGDGTFTAETRFDVGDFPEQPVVTDVSGDGRADLVVANQAAASISVLLGLADGTFADESRFDVGGNPEQPVVTDVNGDGRLDLVVANSDSASLPVLLGLGDGTFATQMQLGVGGSVQPVITDLNADGLPDLVVVSSGYGGFGSVSVRLGRGDGTFAGESRFALGDFPHQPVVTDVNGDGRLDLVVAEYDSPFISVLLGRGDGTFAEKTPVRVGDVYPEQPVVTDLNEDGRLDLVVATSTSSGEGSVSVLLGRGDGTFVAETRFGVGGLPQQPLFTEVNGDGRADLVVANYLSDSISVLLGRGDGTFAAETRFAVGELPRRPVATDLNGDGRADLVVSNHFSGSISVLLGLGDGTFADDTRLAVGDSPSQPVVSDVNGDGQPDLVVASQRMNSTLGNTISVLLGRGDGTFTAETRFDVGDVPSQPVVTDVSGDGRADIVVANGFSASISVLLGRGDGTFAAESRFAVGFNPEQPVVTDVNGDGRPDLVVVNNPFNQPGSISVLLGLGYGTFTTESRFAVGNRPSQPVVTDVSGDGRPDIAVGNYGSASISVLFGRGDGTFADESRFAVGDRPTQPAVTDVNGDGRPDLVVVNNPFNQPGSISVLLGLGYGTFTTESRFAVGNRPSQPVVTDVSGDGRPDIAVGNYGSASISVLLGRGDGTFGDAAEEVGQLDTNDQAAMDVNGDGRLDQLSLNKQGLLLTRLASSEGGFAPTTRLNPDSPWKDFTILAGPRPRVLGLLRSQSAIDIFEPSPQGLRLAERLPLAGGVLPLTLKLRDLDGDTFPELVVGASNEVLVYRGLADGRFGDLAVRLDTGLGLTSLEFADLDRDGRIDILATASGTNDLSVFRNLGQLRFDTARFATDTLTYTTQLANGREYLESLDTLHGLQLADLTGDGELDSLMLGNFGRQLVLLPGLGGGLFANTTELRRANLPPASGQVVSASASVLRLMDVNGDGRKDVVVLQPDANQFAVLLGTGAGPLAFRALPPVSVPVGAIGLDLEDVSGPNGVPDGLLDVIVTNEFGDIVTFLGKGDGTFATPVRASNSVPLVVLDVDGDGIQDVVLADQSRDRVQVNYGVRKSAEGTVDAQGGRLPLTGLVAPGAVAVARLDPTSSATARDLIVANSGANSVSVYRQLADGMYGLAESYFTGQSPSGITVADVNGDTFPDLIVANQGSNDVTILLGGRAANGTMTFTNGPRLNVGAGNTGPIATLFQDADNDGVPDLVVTNSGSGTVSLLSGTGGGFFNDTAPPTITTGVTAPVVTIPGGIAGVAGLVNSFFAITNLADAFSQGVSFNVSLSSSGGIRPGSILMNDLGGGLFELIVANAGDGRIVLFDGATLALKSSLTRNGLLSPSAMALATIDGALSLLVTDAGDEIVTIFDLTSDKDKGDKDSPEVDTLRELLTESTPASPASASTRGNPLQSVAFLVGSGGSLGRFLIEAFAGRNSAGGVAGLLRVVVWARQATLTVFSFITQVGRISPTDLGNGAAIRNTLATLTVQTATRGPQVLAQVLVTPGGVGLWTAHMAAWLLASVPENEQSNRDIPVDQNVAQTEKPPITDRDAEEPSRAGRAVAQRPKRVRSASTDAAVRSAQITANRKSPGVEGDIVVGDAAHPLAVPVAANVDRNSWRPSEDDPRQPATFDRVHPVVMPEGNPVSTGAIDGLFQDTATILEAVFDMPRPEDAPQHAHLARHASLGWAGLVLALFAWRDRSGTGSARRVSKGGRRQRATKDDPR